MTIKQHHSGLWFCRCRINGKVYLGYDESRDLARQYCFEAMADDGALL